MILPHLPRFKTIALLLWLALIGLAASVSGQVAKPVDFIELQKQRLSITPTQFYIARVDDERTDKTRVGELLQTEVVPGKPTVRSKIALKDGSTALRTFIANCFSINKTLRPLIIKVKAIHINETAAAGNNTEGRITLSLQFGLMHDDEFIKLDDYTATSSYQRKAGPAQQVEPLLSNTINNSLSYTNKWMDLQADNNPALARAVKVSFSNYKEMDVEGDTIYYDVNRPLKWADFPGRPQSGKYAAEIFASLGYIEEVSLNHGEINVKMNIKVFVPKSACWAHYEAMNDYCLNHEQRHFDIVKLVAERFKKKIRSEKLTIYNYDGPINVAYLDALREINDLQKQYDGETAHGTNRYQQEQWNNRIDKELQQSGTKAVTAQAAEFN